MAATCGCSRGTAYDLAAPCDVGGIRVHGWGVGRELLERLHLAAAAGREPDPARVAVPAVRFGNRGARQHTDPELAGPARPLPPLRGADLAPLPAGRGGG